MCGVCSPVYDDSDFATDGDADLEDVVIGYEGDGDKNVPAVRELPTPKGMSATEWRRHCISQTPYCDRCPFCVAG